MKEEHVLDSIAIIGMDCRLPDASNVAELWRNLKDERECLTEFSKEELLEAGETLKDISDPHYVARRGIVSGVDKFDATFFGFTPREAELLDPQHRLFLECCWHSLEDAGYAVRAPQLRVGVFGGAGTAWYLNDVYNNPSVKKYADPTSIVTGSDRDYLTTRVSYKLNLNGPSLDVQSACSTAMASIVLGVQSLLHYAADLILAGGVSVQYPEKKGYVYVPGALESSDGSCRPFDKKASGTAFSRGCGVVLLKRLEDALRDHDQIYAVIRAGAVNNDGNKKVGFTAPSIEGQKEVIWEALERAGVSAEQITMVEAHGTATPVGDPIEVASLTESFRHYTSRKQYCALGSVKSNIGHTDAASGAAAVIKTALALKYGQIPASINYSEPNPKIDFPATPFFVNTKLREWTTEGSQPRLALVNSFGVGGTNACVIMEEPPAAAPKAAAPKHPYRLLALSNMQKDALGEHLGALKTFLTDHPEANVSDVAYTSLVGRRHFKHRAFVAFKDRDELLARLGSAGGVKKGAEKAADRPLTFMFPGQGNQHVGMGQGLYGSYPVFRAAVDECAALLLPEVGRDIREVLYPKGSAEEAQQLINQTFITQPALFTISYAQACLLRSWGLQPDYLMGHSVGEYVAAALAGIFSLQDALKAVAYRAKLVQALPGGAMCAVLLPEAELAPLLTPALAIGVVNYPGLCVASGPYGEVEALEALLSQKKIFNKRIPTSHAFHSAMMEPMLEQLRAMLSGVKLSAPQIPIISTATGALLTNAEATSPDYWVQHVRKTVRFSDAVVAAKAIAPMVFVEAGPGQSLESAVKRHLEADTEHTVVGTMRTPTITESDEEYLTTAVGNLWAAGVSVNLEQYFEGEDNRRTHFPLYPYSRKTYIVKRTTAAAKVEEDDDVKNPDLSRWTYTPSWKKTAKASILLKEDLREAEKKEAAPAAGTWLIFDDGCGIGQALKALLKQRGEPFALVSKGDAYRKNSAEEFTVSVSSKEDYERLLTDLLAEGKTPNRVVHLWSVEKKPTPPTLATCGEAEELAYYSPLYTEQAFISHNAIANLNLLFVANGALSVAGEPLLSPQKTLAAGPARCIYSEMKQIFGKLVDVDSAALAAPALAAQLLADEVQLRSNDTVVALRNGARWTECFNQTPLYEPATAAPTFGNGEPLFRPGGAYLITGGTGGLGLEFAKHIAQRQPASTIILTYRTPLPPKSEWEQYAKEHPADITTEKIGYLRRMEAAGTTVHLFKAEANDYAQMKALKEFADKECGGVNGVIHSAGAAGGGIIALKTKQMSDDVLKAKTRGTLIIDELFGIDKLDFVVYFSSVSSVWGESSRVDYTGANSFLDSYAAYRNQLKPGSAYAINWDSWSKVGMAARWEETQALTRKKLYLNENSYRSGIYPVSATEAEEVYQVGFDANTDWVYKEHLLGGRQTIVGTSIINFFAQYAKAKFAGKPFAITDLYFLKPLTIQNGEHPNLRIYANPEHGKVRLSLSVLDVTKNSDKWDAVATAYVALDDSPAQPPIDLGKAIADLGGETSTQQMFASVQVNEVIVLSYSDRWLNIKKSHRNGARFIVEQALNSEFAADTQHFLVHPSLLDALIANLFRDYTSDPFLPFNYKKILVHAPFTSSVVALVDVVEEPYAGGSNSATFSFRLFSDKGECIFEAEKYSLVSIANSKVAEADKGEAPIAKPDESYILPEEGVKIFERILHYNNDTNVLVTPYSFFKNLRDIAKNEAKDEAQDDNATTYERPDLSTEYVAPTNEIEETIAKIWGQVLGIGQIGINDSFNELGGNSLLVVQAVSNISAAFNIQLPIDIFKGAVTVKSLSDHVMGLLVQDIDDAELSKLLKEIE
ncbi:MAG: acyltransferase domain-containing protein [Prevotellaceae bacterium]|jgi:acyl transferase domain-containing protein/acyl carrier protein|nr:acyltransferase domain-containing protein [Prevotellaceae bacterium]